jgi:DtxR family transcriptional regulator, Mn-dependent transcriptional regulator
LYSTSGLSLALEDYLETMLEIAEKEKEIRVTDIAESLQITKATVSETMHKLKKMGMVEQKNYGPVSLTERGRQEALQIRKRHRVIKKFLVEVLDVDHKTAEKEACLMEHILSNATMKKLAAFVAKNHKEVL